MLSLRNIHPLSDFMRNAKTYLARLKKTGQPDVLTVNGDAQAVILSAEAYEAMVEELETLRTLNSANESALEMLRVGEISAEDLIRELRPRPQARGVPVRQAFAELERKFQLRRKKSAS